MTWILRGAAGLALALGATIATAQTYGPMPGHDYGRLDPAYAPPSACCAQGSRMDAGREWERESGYAGRGGYVRDDRYARDGYDDERFHDWGRLDDRYAPPAYDRGYREAYEGYDRAPGPVDRYGPRPYETASYDNRMDTLPTYGGARQHYVDARCNTCARVSRDCGCAGGGYYSTGVVDRVSTYGGGMAVAPGFFYESGGVGPIPDGGGYGGGGMAIITGGGSGFGSASSSASAHAFASSSSNVSISVGGRGGWSGGHGGWGGHGGGWGGKGGGCGGCGGGHH